MFIDMHVHPTFYAPIQSSEDRMEARHRCMDIHKNGIAKMEHIANQMRCAGLDRLCLLGMDARSLDGHAMVANEEVKALVELHPDRFIGFASVDPFLPDAADRLEEAFTSLGLSGLNLHTGRLQLYPMDARLIPLYDVCQRHDKPIMFSSGLAWEPNTLSKYCRPVEFEPLAMGRPSLRFCLGQFGWPWVQEAAMLMVKYKNVYADTAILYFDSAKEFYRRVFTEDIPITWIDRSLRHQVMFGSNNPRFEQIRMAQALFSLSLRDSTLDLIKGANALEFLGGGYTP